MQNFTKNAQFECKGICHLSTALLSSLYRNGNESMLVIGLKVRFKN